MPPSGKRIVIATLGSLGDLHPCLAVGTGLQRRGHDVVIATSTGHRARIEAAGLEWRRMRPEMPVDPAAYRRMMDPRTGPESVFRHWAAPAVRDSHADLLQACQGASLLLSMPLALAAPLVAEQTGLPWASMVLQPMGFFSAHDPPVPPHLPWLARLHWMGPVIGTPLLWLARFSTRGWTEPVQTLRAELGLPPSEPNLFWGGRNGPLLTLAMFPAVLGARQPDWPAAVRQTGFPFWEETTVDALPPGLDAFLQAGPAPLVFTLGSAAVQVAGGFFTESLKAARALGRRTVLLLGPVTPEQAGLPAQMPADVFVTGYVPHAAVFPRAAAVIHQGGIGTLAQAMRAGRPMLVVPFSHDQPDNAARAVRLGIARMISARRYMADGAAAELGVLLGQADILLRAGRVAEAINAEDGAANACDAIEGLL